MTIHDLTDASHPEDDEVEQAVNARPLELCLSRVLHELGVLPGEDDDAVAPQRVPQHRPAQQDVVVVQRVRLPLPCQRAGEPGEKSLVMIVDRM